MVRALWTAASGMIAQQTNVDNIANNLANVNTTGYKTSTAEFKSLLYQTIQTKTTSRMPPARSPLSVFGNTFRIPFSSMLIRFPMRHTG